VLRSGTELVAALAEEGARLPITRIAPTGTISFPSATMCPTNRAEFAHHYSRNVIREGRKTKEKVEVFSYELLAYRHLVNSRAIPHAEDDASRLPEYFVTAQDIYPTQHVDIQAAAQKWVDSSISKTANVPTEFAFEKFKDIYTYAYHQGLKGCTTFRFNPEAFQGVLVNERDLENTKYRFVLDDGEVIEVKGNEEIEYDGEMHKQQIFDALQRRVLR
jgi:ribonucleoside-diphosphate reductase alpha chain